MSDDTGRLRRAADPAVRRMLFDHEEGRPSWKGELDLMTQVDQAHVVMLCEQGIIDLRTAATLLDAVVDVRARDFAPLEGRPTPRGLYLAYEGYLIERLGEQVGGVLHTGRSRNDLNATCTALALRQPYRRLTEELVRLGLVLLRRARQHETTLMPAYTHYQPAVPISFGHQVLGLATALLHDLEAIVDAGRGLDRCALGAGAIGGTTIPIDATRTAALLGFTEPVISSVDAIASRDTVLRLVAAAAILGVTVDRAALDLLLWSSERGFVALPDGVVGSSSMMPQKRNPFVLEHVQGRSAAALGALVGAATAMRGTPFTNSIAVGGEGVGQAMAGLQPAIDAVELLRRCYAGVEVDRAAMAARADEGLTTATALAEQLVVGGVPFRRAHHDVGTAVCAVLDGRATTLVEAVADVVGGDGPELDAAAADADAVRRAADHGGGPGPVSFRRCWDTVAERWRHQREQIRRGTQRWEAADARLTSVVDEIRALGAPTRGPTPTRGAQVRNDRVRPQEAPPPRSVELRSDTFTLPTAEMLAAAVDAPLGDDVYGEDPTVAELERLAADRLDKDAACFMPSGTMANLATILARCPRGSKVIVGSESDIYLYEAGGASVCGGVVYHPITNAPDGTLPFSAIEDAFPDEPEDPQFALPALLCLENPQNRCGGRVLPLAYLAEVAALAHERGIPVHMDGARLFNAAIALDVPPAAIVAHVGSVQICLSKGLGAPVGSMVVGDAALVADVRHLRKMLGGGMRQAGVLAAAGILALEGSDRLVEDHETAMHLAKGLAAIPHVDVDLSTVETNMVFFRVLTPISNDELVRAAAEQGIRFAELGHGRIRCVTHRGIDVDDVERTLDVLRSIVVGSRPRRAEEGR